MIKQSKNQKNLQIWINTLFYVTLSKAPQTWACPFGSLFYIDVRVEEGAVGLNQPDHESIRETEVGFSVLQMATDGSFPCLVVFLRLERWATVPPGAWVSMSSLL